MIPITQTRTGKDGNCFSACLASILELPLAKIPEFGTSDGWLRNVQRFLAHKGLCYLQVDPKIDDAMQEAARIAPVWHTIEGISPRGGLHACVGRNGQLVWDPHPLDGTGRGLDTIECFGLLCRRF